MHTHWRLAFMFDAPGADLAALAEAMKRGGDTIRAAAAPHHVRMGVADRHADLAAYMASAEGGRTVRVDGAIEISIANERQSEIPALCQAMRPVLAGLADMNTVHVMTGPMHHMVPVRSGECFLSLAFRHDPAITPAQMHDWWINHHAGHAIPVLGEGLLAYDQVHVSRPVSETAAAARAWRRMHSLSPSAFPTCSAPCSQRAPSPRALCRSFPKRLSATARTKPRNLPIKLSRC